MALLSVRNVTKRFGGLLANEDVGFEVEEGSVFAVIGPNGAGKTTLFNTISGFFAPSAGSVHLDGRDITGRKQAEIAGLGLIRTYQLVQLFADLTVAENVAVGFHRVTRGGVAAALIHPPSIRAQERHIREETERLLHFVGLGGQGEMRADQLPYGRQRLLELARALAAQPRLLLLDEPAAGLNTQETDALAEAVERINAAGVTVLIIEHDVGLVMRVAHRIVVLDFGRKIAEGSPAEVRADPAVIAAYLGEPEMSDA